MIFVYLGMLSVSTLIQALSVFAIIQNIFLFPQFIMKTYLYNFDPLKPHFFIIKLGFTGVYITFLISAQKHTLWVLIRTVSQGSSNEYPQSMFWAEIRKISEFLSENFQFFSGEYVNIFK